MKELTPAQLLEAFDKALAEAARIAAARRDEPATRAPANRAVAEAGAPFDPSTR